MRRRTRMFAVLLGIAATAQLLSAAGAGASYHLMKIRALFEGPTNGGFVELQMHADGQNFVNGQHIDLYSNVTSTISFPLNHDVAQGGNQRTVLISDNASLAPDFSTGGNLHTQLSNIASAGALCYSNIDCVSWGTFNNFALLPSPASDPLSGLSTSQVVIRGIGRGCPTALDEPDDTNDSAADFSFGVFSGVRSNATTPTETLCPTTTTGTTGTTGTTTAPKAKKKCKKREKKTGPRSARKHKCKKKKRK